MELDPSPQNLGVVSDEEPSPLRVPQAAEEAEQEGLFPPKTMLSVGMEDVKEYAIALLEEGLGKLKIGENDEEPSIADNDDAAPDIKSAVKKLNNATTLLFRILSVLGDEWHPDADLPKLTKDDLEKTIFDADAAIQNLIDANERAKTLEAAKTGIVHKLAKGAKSVCVHLKPFLKTFLSVAVQGSAVNRPLIAPS